MRLRALSSEFSVRGGIQCADASPTPRDLFSRQALQRRRRNLHKMCEGRIAASRHVSAAGPIVCLRRRYSPSFSVRCHCSSDHAAPSRKTARILSVELSSATPAAKNGRADWQLVSPDTLQRSVDAAAASRASQMPAKVPPYTDALIIIFLILRVRLGGRASSVYVTQTKKCLGLGNNDEINARPIVCPLGARVFRVWLLRVQTGFALIPLPGGRSPRSTIP